VESSSTAHHFGEHIRLSFENVYDCRILFSFVYLYYDVKFGKTGPATCPKQFEATKSISSPGNNAALFAPALLLPAISVRTLVSFDLAAFVSFREVRRGFNSQNAFASATIGAASSPATIVPALGTGEFRAPAAGCFAWSEIDIDAVRKKETKRVFAH